jgi:hypothetical protein
VGASARGEAAAREAMGADYGATTGETGRVSAAKSAAAIASCNSTATSGSTKATAVTSTKPAAVATSTHRCVTTAAASTTATTTAVSATAVLSKGRRANGQQDRKRTDEKADFGLHNTYSDASHRCAPARPRGLMIRPLNCAYVQAKRTPAVPADSKW